MVKQIRKRVLAMLMTLAMVVSLMPAMTLPARAEAVTIGLNAEPNTPLPMNLHELSGNKDLDPETNDGIYYMQVYSQPVSDTSTAQLYTDTPGDIAYGSMLTDALDNNYTVYFLATQTGTYTFTITLEDDYSNLTVLSFTVDVNYANTAPTVTTSGGSTTYTENASAATIIDSGISISDIDGDADWNGGRLKVQITANNTVNDTLSLPTTNEGAIWIDSNGNKLMSGTTQIGTTTDVFVTNGTAWTFTFTSSATSAFVQATAGAILFSNSSDDPGTSRTITYTATDKNNASASSTKTVSITAVNDAPTVGTNLGITVSEGSADTVIAQAKLEVTDVDTAAASITYTLTAAPANGTLKKSGTALGVNGTFTQDDINNSRITYTHNGSETASDSFTFTVSDGAGGNIGATSFNITVTPMNDAPVLTASGGTMSYTENASPVVIDVGITVSEVDNTTLASATVTISESFQLGEDVLGFTSGAFGNILGSYNAGTGVLTLTSEGATATVIQWQDALRAVTYSNSSQDPTATNRTISFVVNDSSDNSNPATKTVSLTPVNDAPTLTVTGANPTFTENGAAVALFSGASANTVESGQTITELKLTVSNLSDGANEILNIDGSVISGASGTTATNGMSYAASISSGTATVTLTKAGGISTAAMAALVNGITYSNSSENPTAGGRVVTLTSITDNGLTANGGADTTTLTTASTVTVVRVPKVTSVTSTNDNGTYGIGATIDITVTFSEAVTVTGTPQLTLETGAFDGTVNYASGSGSDTLTFTYTTQAGDASTDLDYIATSPLSLNGGAIKSTANNVDASLALPAPGAENSLGHNKAIVIEAFPTVSLSVSPANIAENGGTSTITASIPQISSQNVVVTIEYTGTATSGTDYNSDASTTITIPAGSLSASAATGITAIQDTDTEGNETIIVNITGVSKGVSDGVQRTITILDDDVPTVTNVTSSTADGSYKAGNVISIQVTFSAAVTVTGTPQLLLETGTTDRTIDYASTSGSTLTFNYTVQAGDNSTDLDYKDASSLTLNGGTITSGGISASLVLPAPGAAGSIGAIKAIVVDAIPPSASIALSDTALRAGETSTVTITFSEKVAGFANEDLTVENGTLSPVGTSDGGTTWTATFTPTADIVDTTNIITLTLSNVTDLVGNAGTGTINSDNYAIDTLRPTATIVVSDTALKAGETSAVTITFSEAVAGFTTADITAANGALSGLSSSDGGITWTVTFTPTAGITDASNVIILDNTGIADAAGNAGTGTTNSDNYAVDTVLPTVSVVSAPSNATYVTGQNMDYTVSFSEAVTVSTTGGTPYLTLTIGAVAVNAAYESGSGTTSLVFRYTVVSNDADANGVALSSNVTLNGGTIKDAAGNDAALTFTGSTAAGVLVDAVVPTISSVTGLVAGTYTAGNNLTFTATFNENVTVTGSPYIALTVGTATVNAAYVSGTGTTSLAFRYTVVSGNLDADGIVCAAEITLPAGAAIRDAAGNEAALTYTVPTTSSVLVDAVAPTISSAAIVSGNSYIDLVFSEGIYGASGGATALAAAKLALTFTQNSGSATNVTISSIKKNDNTAEASASALTGGETTIRVFLSVTGTPSGAETIEIKPTDATSIYDFIGNSMASTETTGTKTLNAPVSYGGDTGSTTNNGTAVVEVNGEKQDAGQTSTQTTGGTTTTTITVDDTKLNNILEQKGNNATVTLPASGTPNVVVGQLTGQTVKNMETKEAVLEIKTETVTYTLPASQINIDAVSSQLGAQVELKDIKVSVRISEPAADTVRIVEDTANRGGYQLVVKPVEFKITCTNGDQTVEVSRFNGYVERTIAIPDGIDPSKITTGIVLNADGTFSHVPTQIIVIDGKYYAKINSLTNSTYSVVYNPVIFTDMANHWAKDAVNDMGSRMVVTGIGNGIYEPSRSITRAEFAAIIVRALGLQKGSTESAFGDVTVTDWFNGYVDTATSYSLITGYDSASFAPNDTITREQAMTILARAMKLTGLSVSLTDSEVSTLLAGYTDGASVSSYAKAGVAACIKTGVVTGTTASTLSPKDSVTRAEVAVMVQRLLEKSGLI